MLLNVFNFKECNRTGYTILSTGELTLKVEAKDIVIGALFLENNKVFITQFVTLKLIRRQINFSTFEKQS